jgi:hypothetical protein
MSHKAERRPGSGEIWLAVTKHDGVQVDSIVIDQAKFGQALGQVRAGNFDLPVALGLQLADRAPQIAGVLRTEAWRDVFFYDGRYYTVHDDQWFYATRVNTPWISVAIGNVPRSSRGTPSPTTACRRATPAEYTARRDRPRKVVADSGSSSWQSRLSALGFEP